MMSKKYHNRTNSLSQSETTNFFKPDEKNKFSFYENLNSGSLNNFYNNGNSDSQFKKKLDKLNFKFYLETDKFMNFKSEIEKSQDNLFLILFKQLSVYVDEIERLNLKLKEKEDSDKHNKYKLDEISKKDTIEKEITYYKATIRNLEKKISDTKVSEDKLKKENESYRRQVLFYKEKLKMELSGKKESYKNIFNVNLINTPNGTTTNFNIKKNSTGGKIKGNRIFKLDFTKDSANKMEANVSNLALNEDNTKPSNSNDEITQFSKIKINRKPSEDKNLLRISETSLSSLNPSPTKRRRNISAFDGNKVDNKKFINTSNSNLAKTPLGKPKHTSLSSNKNVTNQTINGTVSLNTNTKNKFIKISKDSKNSEKYKCFLTMNSENKKSSKDNLANTTTKFIVQSETQKNNKIAQDKLNNNNSEFELDSIKNEVDYKNIMVSFNDNLNRELEHLNYEEVLLINLKSELNSLSNHTTSENTKQPVKSNKLPVKVMTSSQNTSYNKLDLAQSTKKSKSTQKLTEIKVLNSKK